MATIIDELDAGCTLVNGDQTWTPFSAGYLNSFDYALLGNGTTTAKWTFTGLTAGRLYLIAVTYVEGSNRPSNASYQLYDSDGTTTIGAPVVIDQRVAATDFTASGVGWKTLFAAATPTGTSLSIKTHNNINNTLIVADAAYIELLPLTGPTGANGRLVRLARPGQRRALGRSA